MHKAAETIDVNTRQKTKKIRRSQAQWEALLHEFEQGDFSVQAFCQLKGVAESTFYKWRDKLGNPLEFPDPKNTAPVCSPFLELVANETTKTASPQDWMIELAIGQNCVLRIRQPN